MECKQPSEDQFSSPSIEISYTRQTSRLSLISHISQTSAHYLLDIKKDAPEHDNLHSDSGSSNYEEDEDSKMVELPDIPIFIADDEAVRMPLTPEQPSKGYHDPYSLVNRGRASPLQMFLSKGERSRYSKYKVVDTLDECLISIGPPPIRCFNDESAHYWHRMTLRLSMGILLCTVIAVTTTLELWSYSTMAIYGAVGIFMMPFIIFCAFTLRICAKYQSANRTPSDTKSIAETPIYKDVEVRKEVVDRMNRKHFKFAPDQNMVFSNHSASASLNSILSSIYNQSMFMQFPSKRGRVSLLDIHELIQHKILGDFQVDIRRFPKIKVEVEVIDCEYMGLKRFRELVTNQEEDPFVRTYYIAEMNRQPLFYCDGDRYGVADRVNRWVLEHGYFSVIVGSHTNDDGKAYVMMADGDCQYGDYMVAVDRLHDAVQLRNHRGECGGLLRISAHSIL